MKEKNIVKHKYYISVVIQGGFVGLYYSLDYTLDTIEGIQKVLEEINNDGYENAVVLFFKELK